MRIFVLTGAGISAESGLGTFRDSDGLWAKFNIVDVASIDGYRRDPARVLNFYSMRREVHLGVEPNIAHAALARLEAGLEARGGALFLCTQNVDTLHERAGARRVVHMHGRLGQTRCHACGHVFEDMTPLSVERDCGACGRVGALRPNVVWFGETPHHLDEIGEALASADLFVAIGTSGAVYPAAGFVSQARRLNIATIELNLEPSETASLFDDARYGRATEVIPSWVEDILGR